MTHKIVCARYNENIDWLKPYSNKTIVYNKGKCDFDESNFYLVKHVSNLGREGGTFLDYIIEYYSELPDFILFVQGKPFDHVYAGMIKKSFEKIKNIQSRKKPFEYLSTHFISLKPNEYKLYESGIPALHNNITKIICSKQKLLDKLNNLGIDTNNNINILCNEIRNLKSDSIFLHDLHNVMKRIHYFNNNKDGQHIRDALYNEFEDKILNVLIKYGYSFGYGAMFQVSKERIMKHPLEFWIKLKTGFNKLKPGAGWGLEKSWNLILNSYYQRIECILNTEKIDTSALDYLCSSNLVCKTTQIIFLCNSLNNKWGIYKKFFTHSKLICKKNKVLKENYFKENYKNSINLVMNKTKCNDVLMFASGLNNVELINSICELSKYDETFYLIVDRCIFNNEFFTDNKNLAVIYDFYLTNQIKIIGYSNEVIICQFIK